VDSTSSLVAIKLPTWIGKCLRTGKLYQYITNH